MENALKAAFDWKVRKNLARGKGEKGSKVIHFREAFHGRSGYTLSLTNTADPRKYMYFPKFDWPRILNPKVTFPLEGATLEQAAAAEQEAVDQILAAVRQDPDDIACLIIEPIQGEGGDNHFRPEFLRRLRDLADEHEFLLIFDEVQTGFGATGKWWAHQHFDVRPDIIAFGKKTQCCGIAAGPRLDEVDSVFKVPSRINSTWGGNLVDMVRGTRIIEVMREEGLVDHGLVQGQRLLKGLQEIHRDFREFTSNPRGRGLFCALDLATPGAAQRRRGQGPGPGHDHPGHRPAGPALPPGPEPEHRGPGPGRGTAAPEHQGRHRRRPSGGGGRRRVLLRQGQGLRGCLHLPAPWGGNLALMG